MFTEFNLPVVPSSYRKLWSVSIEISSFSSLHRFQWIEDWAQHWTCEKQNTAKTELGWGDLTFTAIDKPLGYATDAHWLI